VEVQLAYAIGVSQPVGLFVGTSNPKVHLTNEQIAEKVKELFDLRPSAIIKRFGLKNPIFQETAAYGHMGRRPGKKVVYINGDRKEVETFGWEKLDAVDKIKEAFGLK